MQPHGESLGSTQTIRSYDSQCNSRCGCLYHVQDGVLVKVERDPDHPNGAEPCPKGLAAPEIVYHPDRLKYPMKRTHPKDDPDPGWVRIPWEEALDTAAEKLNAIKQQYGAEAVFFYRSAPGGSAFGDYDPWLTRLANSFGSPNTVATTHICNWHRDNGSRYTYGMGMPTPDFENTACILVWGHNPDATWRGHVRDIHAAKARGAKLVVIDPRRIAFADDADLWVMVRPGTDGALAQSMIHVVLEENLFDREFVARWTNAPLLVRGDTGDLLRQSDIDTSGSTGRYLLWDELAGGLRAHDPFDAASDLSEMRPALEGTYALTLKDGSKVTCKTVFRLLRDLVADRSPEETERITWTPADKVREAARLLAHNRPLSYFTYNGIEQQSNAMQTNRAICSLYSLFGDFDAVGGNVIFPTPPVNPIGGQELLPPEQARKRLGFRERPLGPTSTGSIQAYEAYTAILTGKPYPVKALVSIGGNVLTANGDSLRGRKAIQQLDFFLQAELFLAPAARYADIVLPPSSQ